MPTVKVVDVLKRAQIILQDKTNIRWQITELVDWFNDAQLEVVNKRPDSLSVTESFACQLGTLQRLPDRGLRFIKVTRNESGKKRPIRPIDAQVLDDTIDDWHDDSTAKNEALHYVYDNREPKLFYVFPAVVADTPILLSYSIAPTKIIIADAEIDDQVIQVDDSYLSPLLDWILYRCYSKDAAHAANVQRAGSHYQAFYQSLGIKLEGDKSISVDSQLER